MHQLYHNYNNHLIEYLENYLDIFLEYFHIYYNFDYYTFVSNQKLMEVQ